jgi:hypothetical protein
MRTPPMLSRSFVFFVLASPLLGLSCTNAGATPTSDACMCPSPKVELHTTQTANSPSTAVSASSFCPDQVHDVALGGDCAAGGDARLAGTQIILEDSTVPGGPRAGFVCAFSQPTTNTAPITVSVLCLRNAR